MNNIVLAVDGGNSKTDVVLVDVRGSVLAAIRGPGSSPHMLGLDGSMLVVDGLIDRACAEARVAMTGGPIATFGAWFMAGADLPAEERALKRAVDRLDRASHNTVANDTFAILRAGADEGWGVAVVVGAGVNCVARHPGGRQARFPSLGEITGDWGGGNDLGMAALGAAVRSEDGRGESTTLRHSVARHFGHRRAIDVAVAFHQERYEFNRLRELAPVVVAAAIAGDEAAIAILDRQVDEVVSLSVAAIRRLRMTRLEVPVVLGGSVLAAIPTQFIRRIEAGVQGAAPLATCRVCRDRPVLGAALSALDLAGSDSAAKARVRRAMRSR
ncbi:MAG: BadF/BadG/BcrA/BcrD ATPase family protein [Ilumatobacteraceae bacterium]